MALTFKQILEENNIPEATEKNLKLLGEYISNGMDQNEIDFLSSGMSSEEFKKLVNYIIKTEFQPGGNAITALKKVIEPMIQAEKASTPRRKSSVRENPEDDSPVKNDRVRTGSQGNVRDHSILGKGGKIDDEEQKASAKKGGGTKVVRRVSIHSLTGKGGYEKLNDEGDDAAPKPTGRKLYPDVPTGKKSTTIERGLPAGMYSSVNVHLGKPIKTTSVELGSETSEKTNIIARIIDEGTKLDPAVKPGAITQSRYNTAEAKLAKLIGGTKERDELVDSEYKALYNALTKDQKNNILINSAYKSSLKGSSGIDSELNKNLGEMQEKLNTSLDNDLDGALTLYTRHTKKMTKVETPLEKASLDLENLNAGTVSLEISISSDLLTEVQETKTAKEEAEKALKEQLQTIKTQSYLKPEADINLIKESSSNKKDRLKKEDLAEFPQEVAAGYDKLFSSKPEKKQAFLDLLSFSAVAIDIINAKENTAAVKKVDLSSLHSALLSDTKDTIDNLANKRRKLEKANRNEAALTASVSEQATFFINNMTKAEAETFEDAFNAFKNKVDAHRRDPSSDEIDFENDKFIKLYETMDKRRMWRANPSTLFGSRPAHIKAFDKEMKKFLKEKNDEKKISSWLKEEKSKDSWAAIWHSVSKPMNWMSNLGKRIASNIAHDNAINKYDEMTSYIAKKQEDVNKELNNFNVTQNKATYMVQAMQNRGYNITTGTKEEFNAALAADRASIKAQEKEIRRLEGTRPATKDRSAGNKALNNSIDSQIKTAKDMIAKLETTKIKPLQENLKKLHEYQKESADSLVAMVRREEKSLNAIIGMYQLQNSELQSKLKTKAQYETKLNEENNKLRGEVIRLQERMDKMDKAIELNKITNGGDEYKYLAEKLNKAKISYTDISEKLNENKTDVKVLLTSVEYNDEQITKIEKFKSENIVPLKEEIQSLHTEIKGVYDSTRKIQSEEINPNYAEKRQQLVNFSGKLDTLKKEKSNKFIQDTTPDKRTINTHVEDVNPKKPFFGRKPGA